MRVFSSVLQTTVGYDRYLLLNVYINTPVFELKPLTVCTVHYIIFFCNTPKMVSIHYIICKVKAVFTSLDNSKSLQHRKQSLKIFMHIKGCRINSKKELPRKHS